MRLKQLQSLYVETSWKIILLVFATLIGGLSVFYTDYMVTKIKQEEEKTAKLWAESLQGEFKTTNSDFLIFLGDVLREHTSVPAILVDQDGMILGVKGLDSTKTYNPSEKTKYFDPDYFKEQLQIMKAYGHPFEIDLEGGKKNYVFYEESTLLTELRYFPYVQLSVICVFMLVSYFAFNRSRRTQQNQVWVGMAKETAHQLGTPISALYAWMDHLHEKYTDEPVLDEMENDIHRLQMITDRFSKIGSTPVLEKHDVARVIEDYILYFKVRVSQKIKFTIEGEHVNALLSVPLFEWVIENICKNAINAMRSEGSIDISVTTQKGKVNIDIRDTGTGIPKHKWGTIFEPGYTTRKRGWGLGLSLTRRIVEGYHKGDIFVKESEIGRGTTFRIVLQAA